ncbi:hypothetical protein J8J27_32820, partial [Mycobacterium tuberculosis]|nr:hypothetical protein [Mycobacterium tuberculosis]
MSKTDDKPTVTRLAAQATVDDRTARAVAADDLESGTVEAAAEKAAEEAAAADLDDEDLELKRRRDLDEQLD